MGSLSNNPAAGCGPAPLGNDIGAWMSGMSAWPKEGKEGAWTGGVTSWPAASGSCGPWTPGVGTWPNATGNWLNGVAPWQPASGTWVGDGTAWNGNGMWPTTGGSWGAGERAWAEGSYPAQDGAGTWGDTEGCWDTWACNSNSMAKNQTQNVGETVGNCGSSPTEDATTTNAGNTEACAHGTKPVCMEDLAGKGCGKIPGKIMGKMPGKMFGKMNGKMPGKCGKMPSKLAGKPGGCMKGCLVPGANVMLSNVPRTWQEPELAQQFMHCGMIGFAALQRTPDGERTGNGYICFGSREAAQKALLMNGFNAPDGGVLKIVIQQGEEQAALPLPESSPAGRLDRPTSQGEQPPPGATISVKSVPSSWTERDLRRHFIHCGEILSSSLILDQNNAGRLIGSVGFEKVISAQHATMCMDGFSTGETILKVELDAGKLQAEARAAAAGTCQIKEEETGISDEILKSIAENAVQWIYKEAMQAVSTLDAGGAIQLVYDKTAQCLEDLLQQPMEEQLRNLFAATASPPEQVMLSPLGATAVSADLCQGSPLLGNMASFGDGHAKESPGMQAPMPPLPPPAPPPPPVPPATTTVAAALPATDGGPMRHLPTKEADLRSSIYIFHLPSSWSEAELARHFSACGMVVSCNIARHPDGSSRGFGFVDFSSPEGATAAIESMNGLQVEGKTLSVALKHGGKGGRACPY